VGGRKVYDEIEVGRLLDRQVGSLPPAQNLVDIVGRASIEVGLVWSKGNQPSRLDEFPKAVHRRHLRAERQGMDANPVAGYERVGRDIKCIRAALERLEGGRDILRSPDFECDDIEAKRAGR